MKNLDGYFDYAAATPMLPEVIKAMQPYFSEKFYNPSALYLEAQHNRQKLEDSRHVIAQILGAKQSEIIFTAGATEASNLAIKGLMNKYPGCQIITSAIEHTSVLEIVRLYDCKICRVDKKGFIDLKELASSITDKTVLVSVMYANNEIGTIEPIKDIRHLIDDVIEQRKLKKVKLPLYLYIDACQATNYLDLQTSRLGVDLMTFNSDKIYGPKQCGVLYVKSGIELMPLIVGSGQENNMRGGTENLPAIVGIATAITEIRKNYQQEAQRLAVIRDKFIDYLTSKCPFASVNGPIGNKRLANNISLSFAGTDNETILMQLDELGYKVASSSACSASNEEPSHVLKAIGLSDRMARSTLRISLGRYTSLDSTMGLANTILKILDKN